MTVIESKIFDGEMKNLKDSKLSSKNFDGEIRISLTSQHIFHAIRE
jgi:hypothetical protein